MSKIARNRIIDCIHECRLKQLNLNAFLSSDQLKISLNAVRFVNLLPDHAEFPMTCNSSISRGVVLSWYMLNGNTLDVFFMTDKKIYYQVFPSGRYNVEYNLTSKGKSGTLRFSGKKIPAVILKLVTSKVKKRK